MLGRPLYGLFLAIAVAHPGECKLGVGAIFGEFAASSRNSSDMAPDCDDRCVLRTLKSLARGSDSAARDPYVSIVVSGRNDDYGHGFLHRLQTFVRVWGWHYARLGLEIEIVIVEWNPPSGAISLRDAIVWPQSYAPIRFVVVSPAAHERIWRTLHGAKPPAAMLDMVAQNVGVQHARGEFVLLTNPDALPGNELAAFLRSRALRNDTYYRIDRDDLGSPVPQRAAAAEVDAFCNAHSYRVFASWGLAWWPAVGHAASFVLEHRNYSAAFKRWRASFIATADGTLRALTEPEHVRDYFGLHHTTAGDFILVAREHVLRLRGFPESVAHRYWDSWMVALLAAAGLRQGLLHRPLRLFHQPHRKQLAGDGFSDFVRAAAQMLAEREARPLNPPQWGLLLFTEEERRSHVRVFNFRSVATLARESATMSSSERQWMRLLLRDALDALSARASASPRLCHPGPEMDGAQPPAAVANTFVLIANRLLDERRAAEALACYHGALGVLGGRVGLPRTRTSADTVRVLLNANFGASRALEVLGRVSEAEDAALAIGHILAATDPLG
jgi:hypothetical protein